MSPLRPSMIVAELSVNYGPDGAVYGDPICTRFERVIDVNRERGYTLHSWKLTSTFHPGTCILNETIIAVFQTHTEGG